MEKINNYREFRLENGLNVVLKETPTKTVSGRLRVWHGALNERKGEEGIAHFLEHTLMVGGSKEYSPEKADQIRGVFGYFNAYTSLDRTCFPVDMLSEDTELYIKYISDAIFNPVFDISRVEEERQRVLRETADTKSSPTFKDNRLYGESFFGKDSPHNYFILGKEENINSASIEILKKFHSRGYNPNNMDIILVGSLPKNIENLVQDNFGNIPSGIGDRFDFPRNQELSEKKILYTVAPELYNNENPEQSSAQLGISFVAPTETDEDSYAVNMLTKILGGDANSRLFSSVSQRKGLAYGINAEYDGSDNKGGVYVSGNISSIKSDEGIDAIFEEMSKLRNDLVSGENLERLKKKTRYNIAKTFETNGGHVNAIELEMDKGLTPEYYFKKMGEVTPEKIREVAIKYFPKNREDGKYVLLLRDPLRK